VIDNLLHPSLQRSYGIYGNNHGIGRRCGLSERLDLEPYMRSVSAIALLSREEELALAIRVRSGDKASQELMITSNLRLVVSIAGGYLNMGLSLMDIVSEGNIGLMKAVDRFDHRKNVRMSSYAGYWIRQAIRRALACTSRTIRVPVHMSDKLSKVWHIEDKLGGELGRDPTDEEIADELGLSPKRIGQYREIALHMESLDAPVANDVSTELGEVVADAKAENAFEKLRDANMTETLLKCLDVLDERERTIITLRFGLNHGRPQTLGQIGDRPGISITRERVRQICNIALRKLKLAVRHAECGLQLNGNHNGHSNGNGKGH
jgi:RNA polymerase primary sigma factor